MCPNNLLPTTNNMLELAAHPGTIGARSLHCRPIVPPTTSYSPHNVTKRSLHTASYSLCCAGDGAVNCLLCSISSARAARMVTQEDRPLTSPTSDRWWCALLSGSSCCIDAARSLDVGRMPRSLLVHLGERHLAIAVASTCSCSTSSQHFNGLMTQQARSCSADGPAPVCQFFVKASGSLRSWPHNKP